MWQIIGLVYIIVSYWAVGKTYYKDRMIYGDKVNRFIKKLTVGIFIGWFMIPKAIKMKLEEKD